MRRLKRKDLAPAQATVTKSQPEMIAGLISLEGGCPESAAEQSGNPHNIGAWPRPGCGRAEALVLRALLCHGRTPAGVVLAAAA